MFGPNLYSLFCVLVSSVVTFLHTGNIQVKFNLEESGILVYYLFNYNWK